MPRAYTLALRNNNGWEVLLAQKNIIDFKRTLQADNRTLYICENPGEYVIPGREVTEKERERLGHTAVSVFCEAVQLQIPNTATVQQFHNIRDQAYFWLLWTEDNWWMSLSNDDELREKNRYFLERDGAVSIDTETGRLVSSWSWEHYGEVHMLLWTPINNALDYFNPYDSLSAWQEGQYVLAQHSMPAYSGNYPLIEVFKNRRMLSEWSDGALQYLAQNPMVTNIQVYLGPDRKHPIMMGGSGQIIYSKGRAYLKGEKSTLIKSLELGATYFVVAFNGPELVLHQTMVYVGTCNDSHKFSSEISATDLETQDGWPRASAPQDPLAGE
ncbi:MAG TPA: hypothetical protein DC047_13445 [Blastocatellia bacterium]|nr:hypothetical protein [Blastocatellia bacterium]